MNASIIESYLAIALWSSTYDNGKPLDDKFSLSDLTGSPEIMERAEKDLKEFFEQCANEGIQIENELRAAHDFGEIHLYEGGDGNLYFS